MQIFSQLRAEVTNGGKTIFLSAGSPAETRKQISVPLGADPTEFLTSLQKAFMEKVEAAQHIDKDLSYFSVSLRSPTPAPSDPAIPPLPFIEQKQVQLGNINMTPEQAQALMVDFINSLPLQSPEVLATEKIEFSILRPTDGSGPAQICVEYNGEKVVMKHASDLPIETVMQNLAAGFFEQIVELPEV